MRVLIWVGVVALLAAVVPWVYGVWQERSAADHAAEVWAADRAELISMLDGFELPEAYRPIDCPDLVGRRERTAAAGRPTSRRRRPHPTWSPRSTTSA